MQELQPPERQRWIEARRQHEAQARIRLATEYALLRTWDLINDLLAKATKAAGSMGEVFLELLDLHLRVFDEFVGAKALPHAAKRHALSAAIHTASPLDVNLKLFDIMGRIALNGLWLVGADRRSGTLPGRPPERALNLPIHRLADRLCALVASNPALLTPVTDEQVIDIALAFVFVFVAAQGQRWGELKTWISEMVRQLSFSYRGVGGRYPRKFREYSDLADHPRTGQEGYFEEATEGSVLLPTLAFWAAALGEDEALATLSLLRGRPYTLELKGSGFRFQFRLGVHDRPTAFAEKDGVRER